MEDFHGVVGAACTLGLAMSWHDILVLAPDPCTARLAGLATAIPYDRVEDQTLLKSFGHRLHLSEVTDDTLIKQKIGWTLNWERIGMNTGSLERLV